MQLEFVTYQIPSAAAMLLLQAVEVPNWATLGIGGILAGAMFFFYREDRKRSEERLKEVSKDFRDVIHEYADVTRETATLLATLSERLKDGEKKTDHHK